MRKTTTILAVLLLAMTLISNAYALQHIWSDYFTTFEPLYTSNYDHKNWYEVKNSTSENVTFSHSVADGVLTLTSQTTGEATAETLIYYREITIASSSSFETKFSQNNVFYSEISMLRTESPWTNRVWYLIVQNGEGFFKWTNTSDVEEEVKWSSSVQENKWYWLKLYWDAAPNHFDVQILEEGTSTPLLNQTITNNRYDFTDATGIGMFLGAKTTTHFGRFYIDYIKAGSISGTMITPQLISAVVSIGLIGAILGIMKKFGRG